MKRLIFTLLHKLTKLPRKQIASDWWFYDTAKRFAGKYPNPLQWVQNLLDVPPQLQQEKIYNLKRGQNDND